MAAQEAPHEQRKASQLDGPRASAGSDVLSHSADVSLECGEDSLASSKVMCKKKRLRSLGSWYRPDNTMPRRVDVDVGDRISLS